MKRQWDMLFGMLVWPSDTAANAATAAAADRCYFWVLNDL